MVDKSNDPVAVWRKMFDDMERAFGAFALRAMTPPQFARPAGGTKEASGNEGGAECGARAGATVQAGAVTERLDSIEAQLQEIKALLQEMKPKPAKAPSAARQILRRGPEMTPGTLDHT